MSLRPSEEPYTTIASLRAEVERLQGLLGDDTIELGQLRRERDEALAQVAVRGRRGGVKIKVLRHDDRIETISVVGPIEIHHGEKMDHLHSADGLDHYFLQDGTYDGWSKVAHPGMTMEQAVEAIERIEWERRIEDEETT